MCYQFNDQGLQKSTHIKPLTKLQYDAISETELNSFMFDKENQFPAYSKLWSSKNATLDFWKNLIGDSAASIRIKHFYSILHGFKQKLSLIQHENKCQASSVTCSVDEEHKNEAKNNCNANIMPQKRNYSSCDTNNSKLRRNSKDINAISYANNIDDAKDDNSNVEDVGKTEGENDVGKTEGENDVGNDAEANVGDVGKTEGENDVGNDAGDNFEEVFDEVLSLKSSDISDEHTNQDDASCSINDTDRRASDAVRHFSTDHIVIERSPPIDVFELDENVFLEVPPQFNLNGVNAYQDAYTFQFEMAKLIITNREVTVLKDYYVFLFFLRCIEREKDEIIDMGWNYFFGRFNRLVRTKVLSSLKAAFIIWAINGKSDKDNPKSIQEIIGNRQAYRIDFEAFEEDTEANIPYRRTLYNHVSEHTCFIKLNCLRLLILLYTH
jgi:hypothetical protein